MNISRIVNLTVASSMLATVFFLSPVIAKDATPINQAGIEVRSGAISKTDQKKPVSQNKQKLAISISDKEPLKFYIKNTEKKVLSSIRKIASDIIKYGPRTLVIIPASNVKKIPSNIKRYIKPEVSLNRIFLQHFTLDPSKLSKSDNNRLTEESNAPALFIIQFKGPIKTDWKERISKNNLFISSYLGKNTLLVWAKNKDISKFKNDSVMQFVQLIHYYKPEYKLQPRIKSLKTDTIDVTIKLFKHAYFDKTRNEIIRLLKKTPYTDWQSGKYHYVRSRFTKEAIKWLTLQNDIISITLNQKESLSSERQGVISIDNINSNAPVSPTAATIGIPYLSWLTGKFPSANTQFNTFIIDITDSGFDQGELAAAMIHPDLTDGATSRVLYQRRVTGSATTDTTPGQNIDHNGHGTFVASVAAGINTSVTGAGRDTQQVDTSDFHFGMGIAPHAQLGSTKLFYWDGSKTTSVFPLPNFYDLYSNAFIDPDTNPATDNNIIATIFNNSWGDQYLDGVTIAPNGDLQWADWGQYDTNSRDYDQLVRDADTSSAAPDNQQSVIIFSSGNTGWKSDPDQDGNNSDLGYIPRNDPPVGGSSVQKSSLWNKGATSKNTIVVGASENVGVAKRNDPNCSQKDVSTPFADNIYDTAYFSSRGPTLDGRFKPDLVAPGVRINAAQSSMIKAALNSSTCDFPNDGSTLYMRNMGTSFAAPAVAGAAALLQQWFINNKNDVATASINYFLEADVKQTNSNPSPSMTKAWLMNSTTYLGRPGAESDDPIDNNDADVAVHDDLPSNVQGMGLLNIKRALDSIPRIYRDQTHIFNGDLADIPATTTNRDYVIRGKVAVDNESFRTTLVWTDFPGEENTVFGATSRLKNDLDLSVCLGTTDINCSGGTLYNGNNYTQDVSQPGGTIDNVNNVESIWIPEASVTANTDFVIRVSPSAVDFGAVSLNDAVKEQDFSLVIYNAKIPTLNDSFPNGTTIPTVTDDGITYDITSALLENDLHEFSDDGSSSPVGNGLYISSPPDTTGITDPRVNVNFVAGANPTLNVITFSIDDSVANGETLPAQTFTYTVSDGYGATNTATATLNVTGSNDAPTVSAALTTSVTEDDANFSIDLRNGADDVDNDNNSLSVTAFACTTDNADFTDTTGITLNGNMLDVVPDAYNSMQTAESTTLSCSYTIIDPVTPTPGSVPQMLTLTIAGVNDNPTVSTALTSSVTEDDANFSIDLRNGADDVDNDNNSLSVTAFACTTDNADFTDTTGISLNGNTLDVVPDAYDSMQATESTTLTCNYTITDSVAPTSGTVMQMLTLTINGINDIPVINLDSDNNDPPAGIIDFENIFNTSTGTPVSIAGTTEIIDVDSSPTLVTVTLPIVDAGNETLTINTLAANLMFNYDGTTGILTLQPSGTLPAPDNADFAAAIDQILYDNNAPAPTIGSRAITVVMNDGVSNSNTATSTITVAVNPPELTLDGITTNFNTTFNLGTATPMPISNAANIINGNPSVDSATITITNLLGSIVEETLTINGVPGTSGTIGTNIDFSYSEVSGTGVLQFNANGSLPLPTRAEFAAAIDLVRYNLNSDNPNGTPRMITTVINDGTNDSNIATTTVSFKRRPVDLALVLDTSGSMDVLSGSDSRLEILKNAVTVFLNTMNDFDEGDDRLGTVYFNTGVTTFPTGGFVLQDFGDEYVAHTANIESQSAGGWTALGAGLQTALQGLESSTSTIPNRKRALIVFTDGAQNTIPMLMRPTTPLIDEPFEILGGMMINDTVDDGFIVRADSGIIADTTPINITQPINVNGSTLNANIIAIGTGLSGTNLEAMIEKLGVDTGGTHHFTNMIGDGALMGFFMNALTDILSDTSVDIVGEVNTSLPATTITRSHRFTLSDATKRASFVLSWSDNATDDQLAILLKAPNGEFIPVGTQGVKIVRDDFYYIVHLNFPLISPVANINAGGEWEMMVSRPTFNLPTASLQSKFSDLKYYGWVLEDENKVKEQIRTNKKRYKVGEPILVTAKLNDLGIPAKRLIVTAKVTVPRSGLGTFLSNNYLSNQQLDKKIKIKAINTTSGVSNLSPSVTNGLAIDNPGSLFDKNIARLLSLAALPKALTPLNKALRLYDNGKNGDAKAGDGIYSALYANTDTPGSYTFNISVRGKLPLNGNISRESTVTIVTQFDRFDIDKSTIKYTDIDAGTKIKEANKQLFITAVDKFGNLLGPGKSQLIKVSISGGKLIGKLKDLGNGSYIQYISANKLFTDPVISIDVPGTSTIAVDTKDQLTLKEWLLILFIILLLTLFLYWIVKRTGK